MPNVKLRTNMIIGDTGGKVFLKEGTLVDLDRVPLRFRKRKYIIKEGERDLIEERRQQQMAFAEGETIDVDELVSEESRSRRPRR